MDRFLDAKYNAYLDSAMLRLGLTAFAFAIWLGAGYSLIRLAA